MTRTLRRALGGAVALGSLLAAPGCRDTTAAGAPRPAFELETTEPGTPLPADPELVTGVLPNGVHYSLRPLAGERTTRLGVVVRAGSLVEEENERGVAHFVEHVVLDRSQRLGERSTLDFLESQGLEQGSDLNGETHASHTQYHLTLAPEQLSQGVEVLAAWVSRAEFTEEAVERQRAIVLAELRESEGRGLSSGLNAQLLAGYPSARRPPLGVREVLESVPPQRLQFFYQRWYRPRDLAVVAVGPFEPARLVQEIEARFAALPVASQPAPEVAASARAVGKPPSGDQWLLRDPKAEPMLKDVVLHLRLRSGSGPATEQGYRAALLDRLLCAGLRERLAQPAPRETLAPQPVTCNVRREDQGLQKLLLFVRSRPAALRAAVDTLQTEVRRAARFGFLESERQQASIQILAELRERAARPPSADATWRGLLDHEVYGDAVLSGAGELELASRLLPQLELERLNERTRQWFEDSRRLVAAIGSDPSLPSEAALGELLSEVDRRDVAPPQPLALREQLLTSLPEPGAVLRTERVPELGMRVWSLSNGATVTYKQLESAGADVRLEALEPEASNARDGSAAARNASAARWIVPRAGAGEHDAQALSRLLAGKTTRLSFGPTLKAACSGQDLETTLQLLYLHLVAPRRDFELAPHEQLPVPAAPAAANPELAARRRDELFNAYHSHFGNVGGFHFVIVADLKEEQVRALVERYIASLPGSTPSAAAPSKTASDSNASSLRTPRLGRHREDGKAGGNSTLVLTFQGQVAASLEARVEFLALQKYLRLRLREVLREKLGGVYDVGVTGSWEAGSYELTIGFECRPEHVELLEHATREVIAGLSQPGISDVQLGILRSEWASDFRSRLSSADFWLEELVHAYRDAADPRRIPELSTLASHLTRGSLRAAAERYAPLGAPPSRGG